MYERLLFDGGGKLCALAILFIIAIIFFYKERLFQIKNVLYGTLLITSILNLTFDIVRNYILINSLQLPLWLLQTIYILSFLCFSFLPFFYLLYILAVVKTLKSLKSISILPLVLPQTIIVFLVITNVMTNFLFYIDQQSRIRLSSGYTLVVVVFTFYLICSLYQLLRFQAQISKEEFQVLMISNILILLSILLQNFTTVNWFEGIGVALTIGAIFLRLQNPNDYIDRDSGMYKRNSFLLTMDRHIKRKDQVTVIIADLNNFKLVNNLFGLEGGDDLIAQVSAFLRNTCKKNSCYRISGDQFAIIARENPYELVDQLKERFGKSFTILGNQIKLPVSLCIIPVTEQVDNKDMLMMMVENAIDLAKRNGKGSFVELNQSTLEQMQRSMLIEKALRRATEQDSINVYLQPIFSVKENRITSAEVLLRLSDPVLGFISPEEFVLVAEQRGLIHKLGEIAIRKTCEFIVNNNPKQLGIEKIDINLSPVQLMQEDFVENIISILNSYPIELSMLNFEITESAAIHSEEELLSLMNALKERGIHFSMDDYGKGYSNFDTILRFPFHIIKLDKEMLWDSFRNERAAIIYRNTVRMIRELDLEIIAEGAETKEHIDVLKEIGVNYIQGFYYSKPLPEKQFISLIKSWK